MASRFIHDITDVAAACRAVDASTPEGAAPDYGRVFEASVGKGTGRESANCTWFSITAIGASGARGPFKWRGKARLIGSIKPATAEGLSALNVRRSGANLPPILQPRDKPPAFIIGLYDTMPAVLPKSMTIDPAQPLPPRSDVGYVYQCLNVWFVLLINGLKMRGLITDQAPLPGIPSAADPNALVVSTTKIAPPMQTHIGPKGGADAGKAMSCPMVRLRIKAKEGVLQNVALYDGCKPYTDEKGNQLFELLTADDGAPLSDNNIHEVGVAGSEVTLIVKSDSICASNLGISIPNNVELAIVARPAVQAAASLADLADMLGGMATGPPKLPESAAPPPAVAAPPVAAPAVAPVAAPLPPPAAAVTAADMDSLLAEACATAP